MEEDLNALDQIVMRENWQWQSGTASRIAVSQNQRPRFDCGLGVEFVYSPCDMWVSPDVLISSYNSKTCEFVSNWLL